MSEMCEKWSKIMSQLPNVDHDEDGEDVVEHEVRPDPRVNRLHVPEHRVVPVVHHHQREERDVGLTEKREREKTCMGTQASIDIR